MKKQKMEEVFPVKAPETDEERKARRKEKKERKARKEQRKRLREEAAAGVGGEKEKDEQKEEPERGEKVAKKRQDAIRKGRVKLPAFDAIMPPLDKIMFLFYFSVVHADSINKFYCRAVGNTKHFLVHHWLMAHFF